MTWRCCGSLRVTGKVKRGERQVRRGRAGRGVGGGGGEGESRVVGMRRGGGWGCNLSDWLDAWCNRGGDDINEANVRERVERRFSPDI